MRSKVLIISLGVLALIVTLFAVDSATDLFSLRGDFDTQDDYSSVVEVDIVEPTLMYGMVIDSLTLTEARVKRNQRFIDLLDGHYVSADVMRQLNFVPRDLFDFRKIVSSKKYTLLSRNDSLKTLRAIIYEPNAIDYVIFHLEDSLVVEPCQREVVKAEKSIAGVIQSSLSQTIEELGITHELTNKFVDIFAWQVDFQRLQKGDKFKLIYEEQLVDNVTIGIGAIKGVYFEHYDNGYYAIPYDQGDGLDYFDERGNSLRKALLKYPIEFTRISSRYSRSRFHPVRKVFRAHLGTDFAAPTGTPIRSVGDGIVLEARYTANNGNYVKIRHNSTYTTQYLHMSKIASGMKPGVRVRQGQNIGYVGSTGLANGSHLCYRFWRNGVQVDALRVDLPPSQPIKEESKLQFENQMKDVSAQLKTISFPVSRVEESIAAGR
ncbi:MAG: peptidoglycan DD-metalloendopeptidase family protein [Cyclobacteriaceae bacterium]